MKKGDKFKIDRFNDGEILEWEVQRVCRRHINVKNSKNGWCMPLTRIKDILKEENNE